MSVRFKRSLRNTVSVAPKLKLKMRLLKVSTLSVAVIVAIRVFSFINFGAPFVSKAAEKVNKPAIIATKMFLNSPDSLKKGEQIVKNNK